jgi:hypothetical protein
VIVVVGVLVVLVVVWRARAAKLRGSTLDANQAAQQVQSPYSALYPRRGPGSIAGNFADRFLNRGGKF